MYVFVYTFVCMYVCMFIRVYVCICMCIYLVVMVPGRCTHPHRIHKRRLLCLFMSFYVFLLSFYHNSLPKPGLLYTLTPNMVQFDPMVQFGPPSELPNIPRERHPWPLPSPQRGALHGPGPSHHVLLRSGGDAGQTLTRDPFSVFLSYLFIMIPYPNLVFSPSTTSTTRLPVAYTCLPTHSTTRRSPSCCWTS
jgi:hypothetical protein